MPRSGLLALFLLGAACGGSNDDRPVPSADVDTPAAVERGRALFLRHCALCHGERADGRGARHSALSGPPFDFTQPGWREKKSPSGLFVVIRDGKRGTSMPSWRSLDDAQIWDLVSYVRSVPEEEH
jgi:mono/diheme cytochrome c family protein